MLIKKNKKIKMKREPFLCEIQCTNEHIQSTIILQQQIIHFNNIKKKN